MFPRIIHLVSITNRKPHSYIKTADQESHVPQRLRNEEHFAFRRPSRNLEGQEAFGLTHSTHWAVSVKVILHKFYLRRILGSVKYFANPMGGGTCYRKGKLVVVLLLTVTVDRKDKHVQILISVRSGVGERTQNCCWLSECVESPCEVSSPRKPRTGSNALGLTHRKVSLPLE